MTELEVQLAVNALKNIRKKIKAIDQDINTFEQGEMTKSDREQVAELKREKNALLQLLEE
jgi:hypothetical protein